VRVLVAPQEFKGSLTARQAADAIARGLSRSLPGAELDVLPLADGGPGTVDVLVAATGGRYYEQNARDPLGRVVRARWGALGDGATAVVEMAAASGLTLLRGDELEPRIASTHGTGDLLRAALDNEFRRMIVGAGGSATNDGGAGVAQALGARLLDRAGKDLDAGGGALAYLERIDISQLDRRLADTEVVVATDVASPLCGPDGASLLYGAQKGASQEVARQLDAALAHFAAVIERDLGIDVAGIPGAGAAGGLAAGLIAFCGATVRPGFDVVAEAVAFDQRIERADAVFTGEGRLDRQTAFGKTASGVARRAHAASKQVVAIAGSSLNAEAERDFDAVFALVPGLADEGRAIAEAADLVADAAAIAGRWLA
jgi:glycerate kinase